MARYIDVDKLENKIFYTSKGKQYPLRGSQNRLTMISLESIKQIINELPTVDVKEVVRSEWISNGASSCSRVRYTCRNCHHVTGYKQVCVYDFCPKCGADMRGGS